MDTNECKICLCFGICIALKIFHTVLWSFIFLFTYEDFQKNKILLPTYLIISAFIIAGFFSKLILLIIGCYNYYKLNSRKEFLRTECIYLILLFFCLWIITSLVVGNAKDKDNNSTKSAHIATSASYKSEGYDKNIFLVNEINENSDYIISANNEPKENRNGTILFTNKFLENSSTISDSYKFIKGYNNTFSVSNEINEKNVILSANDKNKQNNGTIFYTNIFKENNSTISATKNIDLNRNTIISAANKSIKIEKNEKNKNGVSNFWKCNSSIYPNFDEQHPANDLIANDSNCFFSPNGSTFNTKPIAYTRETFYSSLTVQVCIIIFTFLTQFIIVMVIYMHKKSFCLAPVIVPINEELGMQDLQPNEVNEEE